MHRVGLVLLASALVADVAIARDDRAQPTPVDRAMDAFLRGMTRVDAWMSGRDLSEQLVAFTVDVRDFVRAADVWLLGWAAHYVATVPDLTPLQVQPLDVESSGFGWRDHPIEGRRKFHHGADYRAERGTPVRAAGDGVVVLAKRHNGYGRMIAIDHGGGLITRYAHLSRIEVDVGDVVVAKATIGTVGSTGRTTGPHLHFEVRLDGRAVDPTLAMRIAGLQRTAPDIAGVAAMALAPEVQYRALDASDPTNRRKARAERERRPSGRRSQALW